MTSPDPAEDTLEAYALAHARVRLARQRWAEAGQPFTLIHSNGIQGAHPLWRALLEAELPALIIVALFLRRERRGY